MKNNAQLINQDSGNVEIYTPQNIIEAARATMGWIDLDPASSVKANERVKATAYYTKDDDGLRRAWAGKVWLNHPFSREGNQLWIGKALREFRVFEQAEAICMITFASTSEAWFKPLLSYPQCFLSPRTNYVLPDGTTYRGATKGSVVTYMGADLPAFARAFSPLGTIKIAYRP